MFSNKSANSLPEMSIMGEFPLLSSWNDNKRWTGFISAESSLVRVGISTPNFPSSGGCSLDGDKDTLQLLKPFKTEVTRITNLKLPVLEFLRELKFLIVKHEGKEDVRRTAANLGVNNPEFYMAIFKDLGGIDSENVEYVSPNFRDISIKCLDTMRRKHIIQFNLLPKYPDVPVKVRVDLPNSAPILWPGRIADAYSTFKAEVDKYILFWNVVDELDQLTKVIDPIQPTRSDTHRRVLMSPTVVVHLQFHPLLPRSLPEVKFSGPEKIVKELETVMDQQCQTWCENKSILENLEDILETEFLTKSDYVEEREGGGSQELEAVCVICYAFEFEGSVPETSCECGSIYHDKCLSDLLVNDCSVKARRNCVDCPVCGLVRNFHWMEVHIVLLCSMVLPYEYTAPDHPVCSQC